MRCDTHHTKATGGVPQIHFLLACDTQTISFPLSFSTWTSSPNATTSSPRRHDVVICNVRTATFTATTMEPTSSSPKMDSDWDWTANYDRWSNWQSDMESADSAEKARLQAQRKRDKMEGLKHISCCSDHSEEQRIYDMTPEQQLSDCETFKTEGLLFYNEGQYFRVRVCNAHRQLHLQPCLTFVVLYPGGWKISHDHCLSGVCFPGESAAH